LLTHNGSNSYISNYTGDLYIEQAKDDGDIIFKCDDGSGGTTAYLTLDGGNGRVNFDVDAQFADGKKMRVGAGADLQLYHASSESQIYNQTGDLNISNDATDGDIKFKSDDGSGGLAEYFRLDGGGELTYFSKHLQMADNAKMYVGSSGDLAIYHNGTTSNNNIENHTGGLYVTQYVDDGDIIFRSDNGSGGVTEYFRLDGGAVKNIVSKDFQFFDNVKAEFGDSSDLKIYHDGSNSYIVDAGTGDLLNYYSNDWKVIQYGTSEISLEANANGPVKLYNDGSLKFQTKSAGANTSYSATSSTDGDHAGDLVYFGTTSVTPGKIYYYTSSGQWELADADAESTAKGLLGVALAESSSDGMLIRGMVTLDTDPGTRADTLFLSTTAGAATSTAPSGSGDIVRVIGYCLDSTNGQVYFNPDGAFVEVTAGG